jgi:hypothetical protein
MRKALITLALSLAAAPAVAAPAAAADEFASVNGAAISVTEFEAALAGTLRQKFYHREVPEAKLDEFRREVAQTLIDRLLLQAEVRRRGLVPDAERVRAEIAQYDSRYAQSERWKQNRAALLPGLERMLGEREVLERLQATVREPAPGAPTDEMLRAYYDSHPARRRTGSRHGDGHAGRAALRSSAPPRRSARKRARGSARRCRAHRSSRRPRRRGSGSGRTPARRSS